MNNDNEFNTLALVIKQAQTLESRLRFDSKTKHNGLSEVKL